MQRTYRVDPSVLTTADLRRDPRSSMCKAPLKVLAEGASSTGYYPLTRPTKNTFPKALRCSGHVYMMTLSFTQAVHPTNHQRETFNSKSNTGVTKYFGHSFNPLVVPSFARGGSNTLPHPAGALSHAVPLRCAWPTLLAANQTRPKAASRTANSPLQATQASGRE